MKLLVVDDGAELTREAAIYLLNSVAGNRSAVLGLPTGRTPEGMYAQIVRLCRPDLHCFAEITTFNLDEYVGIGSDHPSSYCAYMRRNLFDHVDLDPSRSHVPDGLALRSHKEHPELSVEQALGLECARYEAAVRGAGGLDVTFLGLGTNGHIAFNEPGSSFDSRTRVVELSKSTRLSNASSFPGSEVPARAITMGVGTILESRSIVLMASGVRKREAVARLRSGQVGPEFPASALHGHGDVTVIIDRAASGDDLS